MSEIFPGIEGNLPLDLSSHVFSFEQTAMPMLLPYEQMVLAAIIRHAAPRRLFEFGTAQGKSTYIMAANSPPDSLVLTLDLPRPVRGAYARKCLRGHSEVGMCFRETPFSGKVRQLIENSDALDVAGLTATHGAMDFILIDGDHAYSGVRNDSQKAVGLAAPAAILLWHDFYMFPGYLSDPAARGVFPYLNELVAQGDWVLRNIIGTYFVVGCREFLADLPGRVIDPNQVQGPFGKRIVRLADAIGGMEDR